MRTNVISLTSLDNADDWLLTDPINQDPLELLIRAELEAEAELAGFDSVDDYLAINPQSLN
jgi:hypothetical protein